MKTILLAMTEEQHDKRSWRGSVLIGTFVVLSLALGLSVQYQSGYAKEAILSHNKLYKENTWNPDRTLLTYTMVVAVTQIAITAALLTVDNKGGHVPEKEALAIVTFAHAGCTLLRDFLLERGVAGDVAGSSIQDVAFFSPCLALAALWIVTSIPARPITWASLLAVGFGCSLFTATSNAAANQSSKISASSDRAALVCTLAFFSAAMRNIVLRHWVHHEGYEIKPRVAQTPFGRFETWTSVSMVVGITVIAAFMLAPTGWGMAVFCAALTCGISTGLFFVTVCVLKVYGVTTTALFGVWASLLEAILSYPSTVRPSLLACLFALSLLAVGHWFYMGQLADHDSGSSVPSVDGSVSLQYRKPANIHEQYTRLEFLLFASAVIGVIFYVFQPRVSQRDLDTLSYVGLDKVIRRLLSVPAEVDSGNISVGNGSG